MTESKDLDGVLDRVTTAMARISERYRLEETIPWSQLKVHLDDLVDSFIFLMSDSEMDLESLKTGLDTLCNSLIEMKHKMKQNCDCDNLFKALVKEASEDLHIAWKGAKVNLTVDTFARKYKDLACLIKMAVCKINRDKTFGTLRQELLNMSLAKDEVESTKQLVATDTMVDGIMKAFNHLEDETEVDVLELFDSVVDHQHVVSSYPNVNKSLTNYFQTQGTSIEELRLKMAFSTWIVICNVVLLSFSSL